MIPTRPRSGSKSVFSKCLPLLCLLGLFSVGCANRASFDVTITNRLSEPITVWMTKAKPARGNQYEPGWMPPEVLAVGNNDKIAGVAIEPGDTAHAAVSGSFDADDLAILRVYRAVDLNAILSIDRGSPDRLDIPLDPGKIDIDIIRENGQLADVPHRTAKTGP
jgi:hypothetical protein